MARMAILLRMPLFCQLFDFSYATQVSVLWRKVSLMEPFMMGQKNSFVTNNVGLCMIRCSSQLSMPLVTVQDGRCYCFKLNRDTPRGNVALSSFYIKTVSQSDCVSKGYTIYPDLGICIKYSGSNTKTRFTDAQETCNQDGGYLIQIESQMKIDALMSNVPEATVLLYVGAFRYDGEQNFLNVRGGILDPQYWASGETIPGSTDYCAAISQENGNIRGLADVGCGWNLTFFCELLLF